METAEIRHHPRAVQILLLCLLAAAVLACSFPAMLVAMFEKPTLTPTPSETGPATLTASPSATASPSDTLPPGTLPPATLTLTPTNTPPTPQQNVIVYTPMSALAAPNLISPNSTSGRMRPWYQWRPVDNATIYVIWVWQLNQAGEKRDLIINQQHRAEHICSSTVCQVRPEAELINEKRYTWVVQAYGPPGYSPFSSQFTFTAARVTETPAPSGICPLSYSGKFGGGTVNAVAVAEISGKTYAFIGDGAIFKILDVSTPASPVEKGKMTFSSTINGITVNSDNNRYVYVAAGSAGVRILDVSDKEYPAQIGAYPSANDARKIVYKSFSGATPVLFVADGANGIRVLSVSDPQNPTQLSAADTAGTAKDLDVDTSGGTSSGYIFVADYTYGVRYFKYGIGFALDPKGYDNYVIKAVNSVAIEDNASPIWQVMAADNSAGVYRVIVDENEFPKPTPTPIGTQIPGSFAAVDIEFINISDDALAGNYSYAVGGSQFYIINKSALNKANTTSQLLDDARDIAILGNYAYVADGAYGLRIFDVSDKGDPGEIGSYDPSIVAYDVVVAGNQAYVADYNGRLVRLNLSKPNEPYLDGSANLPDTSSCSPKGNPYAVGLDSSKAYVANNDGDFRWINIIPFDTDLQCPSVKACNGGYAKDIDIPGNGNIYLACNDEGISFGSDPTFINYVLSTGLANGLKISGSYAYIAAYQKGLQVMNLSNGSIVASYPSNENVPGNYHNLALYGKYVLAAADTAGLQVISLKTPNAPRLESSYDTTGNAVNITIDQSAAFIADSSNGVVVVDIGDPTEPKVLCSYNTGGVARSVAVSGKYVYVADDSNGMVVLQMPMTPTPKP